MKRLVVAALLLAVLAWLALWWRTRQSSPPPKRAAAADTSASAGVHAVRLYFASVDGAGLVSESREVVRAEDLHSRVALLVAELDAGPRRGGGAVLAPGTSLRHVFLDDEGLLTVDLSSAFRSGFRGGSTTEYLAAASLVRTLGANVPEARRVLILCAGRPLETLGGHMPLDQPFDVTEWP
jgi:hypothetical protein